MTWKDIETPRPYVRVPGNEAAEAMLAAAFGILAGRSDANTLDRLLQTSSKGRALFMNDDCWWLYTDFQCHFHALYGWRPFADARIRAGDFSTWSAGFLDQADEALRERFRREFDMREVPPVGWLPAQYSDDESHFSCGTPSMFHSNCAADKETWAFEEDKKYPGRHLFSRVGAHDLNPDYPLMNCISATDWMLWERDRRVAGEYAPRIERFLRALNTKADTTGYFLFGTQGSQIEYGHGGPRRQASTHLYYWKVLENLVGVYAMLDRPQQAQRCRETAQEAAQKVARFESPGNWLVSGAGEDFGRTYGTGEMDGGASDYLEVWPNVNAAVLGFFSRERSRQLADRFEAVPALHDNHLTVSNTPARPLDELDADHDGFPMPGVHLNGGFFWMHGGSALGMYTRCGHPQTLARLEGLLDDHRQHFSVDYYNDWGRDKASQFPEHPPRTHSVTCAGAFGHFFRSVFGLTATGNSLRITPASLPQLDRLEMLEPITWGGKTLRLTFSGHGRTIRKALLDGKEVGPEDGDSVEILFDDLPSRAALDIQLEE